MLLFGVLTGCMPVLAREGSAPPSPLAAELDLIFGDLVFGHAHWGVVIRSLDSGELLYSRNAERLFVPASNVKLLTAAAALETLGPDYQYRTTVALGGPIRNGVVEGPLIVIGTGDPTFSSRFEIEGRDVFRAWSDSLRAHGITRIAGGVIAVDTAFAEPTLGAGWAWDDLPASYAAEFGALQFNEGVIDIDVFPSRNVLDPGVVVLEPATQYVRIVNDTRTMPPGSLTALRFARDDATSTILIQGEIAADTAGVSRRLAVRGPALYTVSVLRETLREQGVLVEGPAIHHSAVDATGGPALRGYLPLFIHASPPLAEILPAMMKPSQNLIAETLLRTVGREQRGEGSAAAGVAVIDSLLAAWDVEPRLLRIADGSGLSRYNLTAPVLLTALLSRMQNSTYWDLWLSSLPVGGRDGTLAGMMRDPPLLDRVQAKTGTLGGVRALSGYLTTTGGERIVFSTVINSHLLPVTTVDAAVEAALRAVAVGR